MKKSILKKYALLIAKVGGNVQKGQDVVIRASVDQELLVSYVMGECYKLGARHVSVDWGSDICARVTYRKAKTKVLGTVNDWQIEKQKHYNKTLPVFIFIDSEDPDGLKGVSQKKLAEVSRMVYPIMKPLREERENKYQWTIAGAASPAWAKKVFPDLPKGKAVEKLWEAILKTSRCNEDPIKAWDEHNKELQKHTEILNSLDLDYLEYKSSNGTDFKVWLNDKVIWEAGGEKTLGSGIFFNPNIPTEECFTSPIKGKAEGIVHSTKPLSYQSQLIENFWIRFENGKAVEVYAEKNEELLKEMISMDEGACYLGEVALVPFTSPINQTNLLFYNTLYDENAVCHLALGMGFTNLVKGYENYTQKELHEMGVNDSSIHVDFMIGSKDLNIVGVKRNGERVQIFKDGVFAF